MVECGHLGWLWGASDLAKLLRRPSKDLGAVTVPGLRLRTCIASGGACGADRVGLETAGRDTAGQEPQPRAATGPSFLP